MHGCEGGWAGGRWQAVCVRYRRRLLIVEDRRAGRLAGEVCSRVAQRVTRCSMCVWCVRCVPQWGQCAIGTAVVVVLVLAVVDGWHR